MTKKLLAANWKMNLGIKDSLTLATKIGKIMKNCTNKNYLIIPSIQSIFFLKNQVQFKDIKFGAQDCSQFKSGPYTGDISAEMCKEIGCKYVLLGHSERRLYNNETNIILKQKLERAQEYSLNIIFCVGENLQEYKKKIGQNIIKNQLNNIFPKHFNFKKLTIAYEPVWAIGSNKIPELAEIEKTSTYIKKLFYKKYKFANIPVIYGGSVNSKNSKNIFSLKNIEGALVGGSSLKANEFKKIYDTLN